MFQPTRRTFAAGLAGLLLPNALPAGALSAPAGATTRITPGMRFVWMGGAASIAGQPRHIAPDERGEWVDETTGRRYGQFETPAARGVGFVVADVLAAGSAGHLLQVTQFLRRPEHDDATALIGSAGLRPAPGDIPDCWLPRSQLEAMTERDEDAARVARLTLSHNGRTHRAIRTQIRSGAGWSQRTFDLDSGLALATAITTPGSPGRAEPGDGSAAETGSTQLAFTKLVGARRTRLPGPGAIFPEHVQRLSAVSYRGQRTIVTDGGADEVSTPAAPLHTRFEIAEATDGCLTVRMSASGAAPAQRLVPAGIVGSLWMDPRALEEMSAGELLDRDPLVGSRVVVQRRRGPFVTIGIESTITRLTYRYDARSGLLTRFWRRERGQSTTEVTDMRLAQLD